MYWLSVAFPLYHKDSSRGLELNHSLSDEKPQNPMVPAPKLGQTMGHLGHFWLRGGNKLATNCTISYHQMDCPEDCARCFRKVYVTNVLTRYHWMPHCQPFEIPCPEKCPKSFESPGRKKETCYNMFFSEDRHFVCFHHFGILISFTEHLRTSHSKPSSSDAFVTHLDSLGNSKQPTILYWLFPFYPFSTLHQRALRLRVDLLGDKPSNPQPLKPCTRNAHIWLQSCSSAATSIFSCA